MNKESKVDVNVEEIMRGIRMKIQMDEDLENLPAFEDIPIRGETVAVAQDTQMSLVKFKSSLQYVNAGYEIPYYWSFGPAGIKTFLKRVVRKLLKCLILPILEKQNLFNAHVVNCLNEIKALFIHTNAQIETQAMEIALLKKELCAYQEETKKLKDDMDCIKKVDASIFHNEEEVNFYKYGQAGEDSIVAYICKMMSIRPEHVSYLDLGANHARELSNTYYFYKSGASGVLVEANPNLIPELKLMRNRDIILNNCVSSMDNDFVDFYVMSGDGVSTGSKASVDEIISVAPQSKVTETVRVKTISVNTILEQYFSHAPILLNIDIEGSEMDVLTSLDFEKYRPLIIVIETIPYETHLVIDKKNNEIISYLQDKGYVEYAFTGINSIFVDVERVKMGRTKANHIAGTDYTQNMIMNELAARSSYGICLKPGGIAYGPYIVCTAGEYLLEVKVVLFDSSCPTYLNITAEKGTTHIGQVCIKNGVNRIHFSLENDAKEVEFVLQNRMNDNMYLTMVNLQRER